MLTIKTAWEEIQLTLVKRGCAPNLWIFDNEFSKELKAALLKYELDFQRVPPHIHPFSMLPNTPSAPSKITCWHLLQHVIQIFQYGMRQSALPDQIDSQPLVIIQSQSQTVHMGLESIL